MQPKITISTLIHISAQYQSGDECLKVVQREINVESCCIVGHPPARIFVFLHPFDDCMGAFWHISAGSFQ
jgi:hypothetical protein